jgi:hypothetical protein
MGIGTSQGICLRKASQHRETRSANYALGRIQTHDSSVRAARDSARYPGRAHLGSMYLVYFFYDYSIFSARSYTKNGK